MKYQAVFIDRDGTIGGTGHFKHPRDFSPYPFSEEAISRLKTSGLRIFAFTNQHRISRGEVTEDDFIKEFNRLGFEKAYICPHEPEHQCNCHKPAPGMLIQASREFNLDLSKCIVIGDVGSTDILAASAVGATKILVRTGWGEESLGKYRSKWAETEPDYIADNLLDAVIWILDNGE
ncbi:HAD-IIIA family hydrolase [Paenibacillus sp. LMG 31456]|uniref:D,D-heptose 1,7-bisphosphate phosphatase n=2 Tax=Paenibacillus foliorum TaxID=2654974 RepID=A0A972K472_9BACL|nr:HAD-IIIA family hydrolase [Paenibacillus foliorum]